MTTEEMNTLKQKISPIAQKYGLSRVFLFGSVARGSESGKSDIDLRIDKGKIKGYFAVCSLYADIERVLGRKVDLLTTESLSQEFLSEIKKEEILLYDAAAR